MPPKSQPLKRPATETPGRGKEKLVKPSDEDISDEEDIKRMSSPVVTVESMKELLRPLYDDMAGIKLEMGALRVLREDVNSLTSRVSNLESSLVTTVEARVSELVPSSLLKDVEALKQRQDDEQRRKQAMVFNIQQQQQYNTINPIVSSGIELIRQTID